MIIISLLISIYIFMKSKPKNVLIDPLTLFFISLLYYGYFIPVCMYLFSDYYIPFMEDGLFVYDYDINVISFILPLGYMAFILGYRLFTSKDYVDNLYNYARNASENPNDFSVPALILLTSTFITILVVFFSSDIAAVLSGYDGKIQARAEGSLFAFFYNLLLYSSVSLMVWKTLFGKESIKIGSISAVFLVIWSLLTFSKEPIVYSGIVLFAMCARNFSGFQSRIVGVSLVVSVLILVFVIPSFSSYRNTGKLEFINPKDFSLPFLFSDASGPFSALVLAIQRGNVVILEPLWQSLTLWVPRVIWPTRPLDAAESFARAIMQNWQPGYGLGFSPFAEAQLRFGTILSPILLFLSGLSISGLQKYTLKRVAPSIALSAMLVVHGYLLFTFMRGTFSGIFTGILQFWLPFLGATVMLNLAFQPVKK